MAEPARRFGELADQVAVEVVDELPEIRLVGFWKNPMSRVLAVSFVREPGQQANMGADWIGGLELFRRFLDRSGFAERLKQVFC